MVDKIGQDQDTHCLLTSSGRPLFIVELGREASGDCAETQGAAISLPQGQIYGDRAAGRILGQWDLSTVLWVRGTT